jgi:hypothetical protein
VWCVFLWQAHHAVPTAAGDAALLVVQPCWWCSPAGVRPKVPQAARHCCRLLAVLCPSGTGIAAIDWRRVPGLEKDTTARIAGVRVHCGTE